MTALTGGCHCGACTWRFTGVADSVTACNCTLCRRYATLWAYGHEGEDVFLSGETRSYVRDDRPEPPNVAFLFCGACGGVVAWRGLGTIEDGRRRAAVNVRLTEPDAVADVPVCYLDGLGDGHHEEQRGTARDLLY